MKNLELKAKNIFERYRKRYNPYKPVPNFHYRYMLLYGKLKHKRTEFDLDTYNIAVWLHDIGRYSPKDKTGKSFKEREYHKKLGVKIFKKEFASFVQDKKKKDKIIKCILYHSGKVVSSSPELRAIREADRISFLHPKNIQWHIKHGSKKVAKEILDWNWKELLSIVKPDKIGLKIAKSWKQKSERLLV
jgi:hypothetical protein